MLLAEVGAVIWSLLAALAWAERLPLGIPELALLLAAWVTVPLGMEQVAPQTPGTLGARLSLAARTLQPFAAAALTVSFWLPAGAGARVLAAPWLLCCGLHAAALGAQALFREEPFSAGWLPLLSAAFLPVGGVWTLLSRGGQAPMGFQEPIILLTGVHFHYTGFAAPLLVFFVRGAAAPGRTRTLLTAAGVGLAAGIPLLAAGFVLSRHLQLLGVLVLAAALAVYGVLALRTAPRLRSAAARAALRVSSVALLLAMALAVTYAAGEYTSRWFLSIPQAAATHGVLNALGFTLCGLLAWATEVPRSVLTLRRPGKERLEALSRNPVHAVEEGRRNHAQVRVGEGSAAFTRARARLRRWEMLPRWVAVEPAAPLTMRAGFVFLARRLGFWFASPVQVVELEDGERRWSVRWATVGPSALIGHERLTLELRADGTVWFEVESFSRLQHPLTFLFAPFARRQQRAFARGCCEALRG